MVMAFVRGGRGDVVCQPNRRQWPSRRDFTIDGAKCLDFICHWHCGVSGDRGAIAPAFHLCANSVDAPLVDVAGRLAGGHFCFGQCLLGPYDRHWLSRGDRACGVDGRQFGDRSIRLACGAAQSSFADPIIGIVRDDLRRRGDQIIIN